MIAVDALNLRADRRGMGRVVRGVLREAISTGIAVTLLCEHDPIAGDDPAREILLGCSIAKTREARGERFDVVWYPWNGMRFTTRSRSVAHIHDTFSYDARYRDPVAAWRVRAPLRRAAKRATTIVADSHYGAAMARARFALDPSRTIVIPLTPDAFFTPAEAERTTAPAKPYVLIVGATEARKNGAMLVRAFARAFAQEDIDLVAIGGLDIDAMHAARSLNVHPILEMADDRALRERYRNASCVVVPSLVEGFGLVAVEAQACGAPLIASNATALPESAGDAALFIDPLDEDAWVVALQHVVREPHTNADLRTRSLARWATTPRDAPINILAVLSAPASDGFVNDRA